jgi:hypothetical protein
MLTLYIALFVLFCGAKAAFIQQEAEAEDARLSGRSSVGEGGPAPASGYRRWLGRNRNYHSNPFKAFGGGRARRSSSVAMGAGAGGGAGAGSSSKSSRPSGALDYESSSSDSR